MHSSHLIALRHTSTSLAALRAQPTSWFQSHIPSLSTSKSEAVEIILSNMHSLRS